MAVRTTTTLKVGKYSGKASSSEILTLVFFTKFALLPLTHNMKRKGKVWSYVDLDESS